MPLTRNRISQRHQSMTDFHFNHKKEQVQTLSSLLNPFENYWLNKLEPGWTFPNIILVEINETWLLGSAKSSHRVPQIGFSRQCKLSPFKSQDITNALSSHGQATETEEEQPNPHQRDLRYSLELASSEKQTSKHSSLRKTKWIL